MIRYSDIRKIDRDAVLDYFADGDDMPEDAGKAKRLMAKELLPETHTVRPDNVVSDVPYAPWRVDHNWFPSPVECDSVVWAHETTYVTGSNHSLCMQVQLHSFERADVPLLTPYEHVASCRLCNGSSGGCPAYAPRFTQYKPSLDTLHVITVTIDFIWALKYAGLTSWKLPAAWSDRLSAAYTARILKRFRAEGHTTLGMGTCPGKCKPCALVQGEACSKPDKREYSMEGTGIDCDMLHHGLYGEFLPWCYWGMKFDDGVQAVPTYMTRYAGILSNDGSDYVASLLHEYVTGDWSYRDEIVNYPQRESFLLEIPQGTHHAGCKMYFYRMTREE